MYFAQGFRKEGGREKKDIEREGEGQADRERQTEETELR